MGLFLETIDTLKMLPFLFASYLLIEWLEHRASDKITDMLAGARRYGGLWGAALGCIPQCGFSVAAVKFWNAGVISSGALVAVILSTSDEALPVLLAAPGSAGAVWRLLACKLAAACTAGLAVDALWRSDFTSRREVPRRGGGDFHRDCEGEVLKPAALHTVKTAAYIFAVSFALGAAIDLMGADALAALLSKSTPWQPFIAALAGFIPSCGVSVVLTKLYIEGGLTFGGALAGLCTGAGVGLALLYSSDDKGRVLKVCGIVYAVAVLSGVLANAFI